MIPTAFWTSYALLWALVLLLTFVVILLLRQHGRQALQSTPRDEQGPVLGERVRQVSLKRLHP
jgi:hypothetical protein